MSLIEELKDLGLVYQCSNEVEIDELIENGKAIFYLGFDCTAKSLHIGNLVSLMLARKLIKYGNNAIIVLGGATTKIGDPTGKISARKELSNQVIAKNIEGIKKSIGKFLKDTNNVTIVNNASWIEKLNYIQFLKEFGKHFSINKMLTLDSIKSRIGHQKHLSFLEFNYVLLQAYDFYYLNQEFGCNLQIGGRDQWGNITAGVDFIKRVSGNKAFAITTSLITKSNGIKMGKSAQGAIWLNQDMYSPYQYYQFWKNIDDSDVINFGKIYCEFTGAALRNFVSDTDIIKSKNLLAYTATEICHGTSAAQQALLASKKIFEDNGIDDSMPKFYLTKKELEASLSIVQLLKKIELTKSFTQGKKAIKGKAIKINNQNIDNVDYAISNKEFLQSNKMKISFGKKKHVLVYLK